MDQRSSFSNYGTCVDIWAPGSSVLSAAHTSDSGTATFSGTSMACPHVSGAAALVLGADNSKSPQKVISDLLDDAALDTISDLKAGDTNALLLWVQAVHRQLLPRRRLHRHPHPQDRATASASRHSARGRHTVAAARSARAQTTDASS